MKTPKKLRQDILDISTHLNQIRGSLMQRANIQVAKIGKDCLQAADQLGELLKKHPLPDDYKVAVVGRFKAGKSSFVNELLGNKLASENTSPETAAITSFHYGDRTRAVVKFITEKEWQNLHTLYAEDAKHPDAHRIKNWRSFSKPKDTKSPSNEAMDLGALEKHYIRPGAAHEEVIEFDQSGGTEAEKDFRKKLKKFTSGSNPEHCLVQNIEITLAAKILEEGIRLIDTPGLDDTERFRVRLTEETVERVDAVLFLTASGAAYGQSDKDFLLTLLRKGSIKQLIVVITKLDDTYKQHCRTAEDNDENPDSIQDFIQKEQARIRQEIENTFKELGDTDSEVPTSTAATYLEQLRDVKIVSTSVQLHRDRMAQRALEFSINPDDPSGIEMMKRQLLDLLSTESRLASTARHITAGGRTILLDLQSALENKLATTRSIKDKEVAERKLHQFRDEFGKASERFDQSVQDKVKWLTANLEERHRQHCRDLIEVIVARANGQLSRFKTDDLTKHWKTRRSGYWGWGISLQFQTQVANQIFPKVKEMLGDYTELFSRFIRSFDAHTETLIKSGENITKSLNIGVNLPFASNISKKLKNSLKNTEQIAQELIEEEEQEIFDMLNDFVSEDVTEKIHAARQKVSDITGLGTSRNQSAEVSAFYGEVQSLLAEALASHIKQKGQAFSKFIIDNAQEAPKNTLKIIDSEFIDAQESIKDATQMQLAGQLELLQKSRDDIQKDIHSILEMLEVHATTAHSRTIHAGDSGATQITSTSSEPAAHSSESHQEDAPKNWAAQVRQQATALIQRLHLQDGTMGWPWEKIFDPRFLQASSQIVLIDPYLYAPHQLRNLKASSYTQLP